MTQRTAQGTHSSLWRIQHGATTTAALAGLLWSQEQLWRSLGEGTGFSHPRGAFPEGSGCSAASPAHELLARMLQLEVSEQCLWFKNPPEEI